MGYVEEKYKAGYFLKKDSEGKPTWQGVEGLEEFLVGGIRAIDKRVLDKIDFKNKRILEIGYGRGEALKYSVEQGALSVTGVDFSQDAYNIASEFLAKYGVVVDLYCQDAVKFIKDCALKNQKFDIILLLDVIEHIPRSELTELLSDLVGILSEKSVLVINTPVFNVDNDVLTEGLDNRALDTSDQCDITNGMHCNRYTKSSLEGYLSKFGFVEASGHVFAFKLNIPAALMGTRWAWITACVDGFPVYLESVNTEDVFEYARPLPLDSESSAADVSVSRLKRIYWRVLSSYRSRAAAEKGARIKGNQNSQLLSAEVVGIEAGSLVGGRMFLNTHSPAKWNQQMREGTYDSFLYDAIKNSISLSGAVVWDVGAHIGYHSLCFARLTGPRGRVLAFEPNPTNRERLIANVALNPDLKSIIYVRSEALSDVECKTHFVASSDISEGRSSGSHLSDVVPPERSESYAGFDSIPVDCCTGDSIVQSDLSMIPRLIKIDVEGAEAMCLFGCKGLISKYKPHLLIEIHTTLMMYYCLSMLEEFGYNVRVLEPQLASVSRCFVHAWPR